LANIKSAEKRARQAVKRRAHNMAQRNRMRTAIKKVRTALATGEKNAASAALKTAMPVIDTMVSKGIIQKNTANRYKSRLAQAVKALAK
jgi:small subunit ribosomal protein S20